MRLAYLDFMTHFGGSHRSTLELCSRLAPHDVTILDPYGCCEGFVDAVRGYGFNHHVLMENPGRTQFGYNDKKLIRWLVMAAYLPQWWKLGRSLRRAVRTFQPDVIWTSSRKGLELLTGALRPGSTPLAFFARGWQRSANTTPRFLRQLSRRISIYFAQSETVRSSLVEMGLDSDRIHVVPNAIDMDSERIAADGAPDPPLPQADCPIRLVLVATLTPGKGQLCAVRALAGIRKRGRDAALWLAGDEAYPPLQYLMKLRDEAERLGVADCVHFLGWRNDVPRIISASTMVILPSHTEGMPRCVMEAMALRRPVAATPVGAVPEMIIPGRTGWLFDVDDSEALSKRIIEAHTCDRRDAIIDEAQTLIAEKYSPGRQGARMKNALETITAVESIP